MSKNEMRNESDIHLDAQLQALPKVLAPEHDLWPKIEQGMARPSHRLRAFVAAAGIAVISIGLVFNIQFKATDEDFIAEQSAPALIDEALPIWAQQTAKLRKVKAELQPSLKQQLELMNPETRQVIVDNLAIIEQAKKNISDALEKGSQSTLLSKQYAQLWQQEMIIYRQVANHSYKL